MLGTLAAGCCFYWRIYYWPERFGYAWTPYGAFLLLGSHFFDFLYPFVFVYVERHAKACDMAQPSAFPVTKRKKGN